MIGIGVEKRLFDVKFMEYIFILFGWIITPFILAVSGKALRLMVAFLQDRLIGIPSDTRIEKMLGNSLVFH